MRAQTSIDPKLISLLGRKLYSDNPLPIVVRELLQNAVDACKRKGVDPRITVEINRTDDQVIVTVQDNGIGMTAEEIVSDFLCLGGTSKREDEAQVGGFGIAKAALMSNDSWYVHSLNNYVTSDHVLNGSNIVENYEFIDGTIVSVTITEDIWSRPVDKAILMVMLSEVDIHLIYRRDDRIELDEPHAGIGLLDIKRKELNISDEWTAWGTSEFKVPVHGSFKGRNIFRLNGLVQFVTSGYVPDREINLFIEVEPKARPEETKYPLTMSREELVGDVRTQVQQFTSAYDSNVMSSKKVLEKETKVIETLIVKPGRLLSGKRSVLKEERAIGSGGMGNLTYDVIENKLNKDKVIDQNSQDPLLLIHEYEADPIKSRWHAKVLRVWTAILEIVADDDETFGIGITSDRWANASRFKHEGIAFYIVNPDVLFEAVETTKAQIIRLWASACHEVTHAYVSDHNERFTSVMSNIMSATADDFWSILNKCAKILGG